MKPTVNKLKIELVYNLLHRSIVEIVTPDRKGIGFFVASDTILTCSSVLNDTERESIKIEGDGRTYKVIKYKTSLNTDVTTIQVNFDEDRDVVCAELDTDYQSGDELYLCPYSSEKIKPIPRKLEYQNSSNKLIFSTGVKIESKISGSPLLNARTGKICGFVRLDHQQLLGRQDRICRFSGDVILVASIFKEFPEIKVRNDNFHKARSLSNLPVRTYERFIGRESQIKQLIEYISPNYRQHIIVVDGVSGIGKTSFVMKVAYQCLQRRENQRKNIKDLKPPDFDSIIYISLNYNSKFSTNFSSFLYDIPNVNLLLIVRAIADALNAPELKQVYDEDKIPLVYKYLNRQKTLLIVDGIESIDSDKSARILDFLNNLPLSTKAIAITREKSIFHSKISLMPLSKQETIELAKVTARFKNININSNQLRQIWDCYKGMPLATIYATGKCTVLASTNLPFNTNLLDNNSENFDLNKLCFDSILPLLDRQAYELLMSLAFFRKAASRDALMKIVSQNERVFEIEKSLEKLENFSLIVKSYIGTNARYSTLSLTREYILTELEKLSNKEPSLELELRAKWVNWYKDFADKYGGYNMEVNNYNCCQIEQELENIGQVLSWCASHDDYYPIRGIWNNIDCYIETQGYWMIRSYWWEYLEKEAQKRGEISFYVKALSEKISTWIEMGQVYYLKAINSLKEALNLSNYSDRSVQVNLKNSWEKLGGKNFTGIDINDYQAFDSHTQIGT